MKMNKNRFKKRKKYFKIKKKCILCYDKENIILHPFNISFLSKFLNKKAMLFNRFKNALCYKHQRKVKKYIILSRKLHLFPYVVY